MTSVSTRRLLACALILSSPPAFAHTGLGDHGGLVAGFLHPLTGADHLLAMVGAGWVAANAGGAARWSVPAAFLAMMALGGLAGMQGVALPHVEAGIALSVAVFGALIALGSRLPVAAATTLAGLFAALHGYAHGLERPEGAAGEAFAGGFLVASALLVGAGLALGLATQRLAGRGAWVARIAGAAAGVTGVTLLLQ